MTPTVTALAARPDGAPPRLAEPPVFIVGPGRSGTTLMRTLLAAHSRIAVTPETHFLKFAQAFGYGQEDAPQDYAALCRSYSETQRFLDLGVPPEQFLNRAAAAPGRGFADAFAALLDVYRAHIGKPRIGEKPPGHQRFLADLLAWFPDARILFMMRDPRAQIASALSLPWILKQMKPQRRGAPLVRRSRRYQIARHARAWTKILGRYHAVAQDDRVLRVVYEELAADPETQMRRVCRFIDEPFEPSMLDQRAEVPGAAATAQSAWPDWITAHEAQAAAPIDAARIDRWRRSLSASEVAMIEGLCAAGMGELAYAPVSSKQARRRGALLGRALLAADQGEGLLRTYAAAVRRRLR